jgi:hypothetical protein
LLEDAVSGSLVGDFEEGYAFDGSHCRASSCEGGGVNWEWQNAW